MPLQHQYTDPMSGIFKQNERYQSTSQGVPLRPVPCRRVCRAEQPGYLRPAPCALLHQAARHGAGDGEGAEEGASEVTQAKRYELLQDGERSAVSSISLAVLYTLLTSKIHLRTPYCQHAQTRIVCGRQCYKAHRKHRSLFKMKNTIEFTHLQKTG